MSPNTRTSRAIGSMLATCAASTAWIPSVLRPSKKTTWSSASSKRVNNRIVIWINWLKIIFLKISTEKLPYIWTSGRLCNFKGCDREDLQPLIVNGWFWSGSGVKLARTDEKPTGWTYQPWSATGHFKKAQPDNAEFDINQTSEACLGVLNNVYKDGIKWHDIGCYHTKAVICEDSPPLLQYIAATNPSLKL